MSKEGLAMRTRSARKKQLESSRAVAEDTGGNETEEVVSPDVGDTGKKAEREIGNGASDVKTELKPQLLTADSGSLEAESSEQLRMECEMEVKKQSRGGNEQKKSKDTDSAAVGNVEGIEHIFIDINGESAKSQRRKARCQKRAKIRQEVVEIENERRTSTRTTRKKNKEDKGKKKANTPNMGKLSEAKRIELTLFKTNNPYNLPLETFLNYRNILLKKFPLRDLFILLQISRNLPYEDFVQELQLNSMESVHSKKKNKRQSEQTGDMEEDIDYMPPVKKQKRGRKPKGQVTHETRMNSNEVDLEEVDRCELDESDYGMYNEVEMEGEQGNEHYYYEHEGHLGDSIYLNEYQKNKSEQIQLPALPVYLTDPFPLPRQYYAEYMLSHSIPPPRPQPPHRIFPPFGTVISSVSSTHNIMPSTPDDSNNDSKCMTTLEPLTINSMANSSQKVNFYDDLADISEFLIFE